MMRLYSMNDHSSDELSQWPYCRLGRLGCILYVIHTEFEAYLCLFQTKKYYSVQSTEYLNQILFLKLSQIGCWPADEFKNAKVIIVKDNLKFTPTNWQQHKREVEKWQKTYCSSTFLKFEEIFSSNKGKTKHSLVNDEGALQVPCWLTISDMYDTSQLVMEELFVLGCDPFCEERPDVPS